MLAKIQKWGNSQGLRITKNLLADVQLGVGGEVDISVKNATASFCGWNLQLKDITRLIQQACPQLYQIFYVNHFYGKANPLILLHGCLDTQTSN